MRYFFAGYIRKLDCVYKNKQLIHIHLFRIIIIFSWTFSLTMLVFRMHDFFASDIFAIIRLAEQATDYITCLELIDLNYHLYCIVLFSGIMSLGLFIVISQ